MLVLGMSQSVVLSDRTAAALAARIAEGGFESADAAIAVALGVTADDGLEAWLRTAGVEAYAAYKAAPESVTPASEVHEALRARMAALRSSGE